MNNDRFYKNLLILRRKMSARIRLFENNSLWKNMPEDMKEIEVKTFLNEIDKALGFTPSDEYE